MCRQARGVQRDQARLTSGDPTVGNVAQDIEKTTSSQEKFSVCETFQVINHSNIVGSIIDQRRIGTNGQVKAGEGR
ncbi:MAG: hypothetical protein ACJAZ0_001634 [Halioglobus sp.]|jgi:hypothetical protein